VRDVLEGELEKHRAWLKDTLKVIQETKSSKPSKRLVSVKETAEKSNGQDSTSMHLIAALLDNHG
jgi:hypothetical protein